MLKILVVDDEPKVRRGVSRLIEAYPEKYELLGACSNAKAVIEFFGQRVPDVILTDIRMPDQDGLELINHLKHRYHNLDFIILSGYGDFEYAKKALQYQVYDFLLKPLKPQELYDALDGVWEKRKSNHIEKSESLEDNHFFNLIRGKDEKEEKKQLENLGLLKEQGTFRVVILDIGELSQQVQKQTETLKKTVKEFFPGVSHLYICFGYQIIMICKDAFTRESISKSLETLEDTLSGKLYMGVSRTGKDFRELKEKYFQALNALKQYIYSDSKQIFFEDELKGQETAFSDEVCGRIINAVRAGNEDGVREQIEKFLQEYQQKRCRILPMKRQFLLLQRAIDALTEELGMDQKRNRSLGNFIRNIEEIRDFSQIREAWITNLIEITKEAGAIAERKMNSYYINQILDYVQKNYRRDLSLEEVAEYVNLSSGYLSNYFKEKVGMNFVDYLTKLRIEKAKELLMHTNEKIYKIAEDVGYQNSQYFVTIFKKKTGVTPAEYRKCLPR